MRRMYLGFLSAACCGLLACLLVTGCGGGTKKYSDDDDDDLPAKKKTSSKGGGGGAAKTKQLVKGTYDGKIEGVVKWGGDNSKIETAKANLEKAVVKDKSYCLTGKMESDPASYKPKIQTCENDQQEYRVGKNGNLGHVFVWIEPEDSGYAFDIPKDQLDKVAKEIVISQPHCAFEPHSSVHFPSYYKDGKQVPTGQKVVIENDARVSHNAEVSGGTANPTSNVILSPKLPGKDADRTSPRAFTPDRTEIKVSCGVHTWMRGYIRVYDHPYATTTNVGANLKQGVYEDPAAATFGSYEITGVPVGAKVRIFAWHESLKWLTSPKGDPITLEKKTTKDFEAK